MSELINLIHPSIQFYIFLQSQDFTYIIGMLLPTPMRLNFY